MLAAGLATAAHAQLGELTFDDKLDVAEDVNTQTGVDPDTDHTPRAKEEQDYWSLVAGARFGQREVVDGSATSFATDLYAVSFANTKVGFAGGSECIDPETEPEQVKDCKRRPVIYRYDEPKAGSPPWRKSLIGQGEGYVGAIAWIDSKRALAVGGDGRYPRREHARNEGESYEDWLDRDPAGKGRAWLYENGAWRELDLSAQLAQGMRGMTALDFYRGPELAAFGAAGALGQLWHWEDGRFTKKLDRGSSAQDIAGAPGFRFRVRELRFLQSGNVHGFAVTAGCCEAAVADGADARLRSVPRVLAYDGQVDRWFVQAAYTPPLHRASAPFVPPISEPHEAGEVNTRQTLSDSLYSITVTTPAVGSNGAPVAAVSLLASPGGPEYDGERPSAITGRYCVGADGARPELNIIVGDGGNGSHSSGYSTDFGRTALTTARLVAADGDTGYASPPGVGANTQQGSLMPSWSSQQFGGCNARTGDAIPDWAVGELRSRRAEGLGRQGLALTSHLRPAFSPDTVNTPPLLIAVPDHSTLTDYEPTTPEKLDDYRKSRYFLLPSYSLNEIDVIDPTDTGWAVGDRGAILQLGEGAGGAAGSRLREPPPPKLGSRQPASLPERSPYDPVRPGSAEEAGEIPSLSTQPAAQLPEPRLTPAGSPDPTRTEFPIEDVHQIVMSRDGTEGWAIGPSERSGSSGNLTLFRYDGAAWRRCEILDAGEHYPADPACEALAPLRRYRGPNGESKPVRLVAAARVPHENGPDPSNDDEFEIVAIGTEYRGPEQPSWAGAPTEAQREESVILRYSKGRWDFEPKEARDAVVRFGANPVALRAVAFTAPDDGWILAQVNGSNWLFHYDGERWEPCSTPSAGGGNPPPADTRCGDPDGRVPAGTTYDDLVSAGDRVYFHGARLVQSQTAFLSNWAPVIIYREPGGKWTDGNGPDEPGGGYDPGFGGAATTDRGVVQSLSVVRRPDERYEGWAVGSFSTGSVSQGAFIGDSLNKPDAMFLRLRARQKGAKAIWGRFRDEGATRDYFPMAATNLGTLRPQTSSRHLATIPAADGDSRAFVAQFESGRLFGFNPQWQRWELVRAARPKEHDTGANLDGYFQALAPDGRGGFWAAVRNDHEATGPSLNGSVYFFHYTDRPRKPVFEETPHPLGEGAPTLTALAGSPDGTVWAATASNMIARYDRLTGWDTVRVPGWDPGRVVTAASPVNAIAAGPGGEGLAVGKGGRIANLSRESVRLDAAAGTACDLAAPVPTCGTPRDLRAAALAPDGSAIVGGDRLSLLWRPAGGEFRAIARPEAAAGTTITGASMPAPGRAYLTTNTGLVFAGELEAGGWRWRLENLDGEGDLLSLDERRKPLMLRAIAVDRDGRGYAVGERGLILERTGDGERPWRRLGTGFLDNLTTVALPAGSGRGALIGGESGLILTRSGDGFEVARPADYFGARTLSLEPEFGIGMVNREVTGTVVGLALLPGTKSGQAEAWAALRARGPGTNRLLHYASDPGDPLLRPGGRVAPLPDSPPRREGELAFAAFGKSDCPRPSTKLCPEMIGAPTRDEVLAQAVADEVLELARRGKVGFALFSGDATDSAGLPAHAAVDANGRAIRGGGIVATNEDFWSGSLKHRRWSELVADRFADAGLGLYGAIGAGDLAEGFACETTAENCLSTKQGAKAGDNVSWRQAMLARPRPWGKTPPQDEGRYTFRPLRDGPLSLRVENAEADPDTGVVPSRHTKLAAGGASTHYAVDVLDHAREGAEVARLVFVDNSLRSLAASDPIQQPVEPRGGQSAFLERMLCFRGERTSTGERCTRAPGQRAVVVANTPTYSYGPGALTDTATDGVAFETLLLKYRTSAVVSGRLGWNGLYWALAPGLHFPCPGGQHPHPAAVPDPDKPPACGSGAGGQEPPSADSLADQLGGAAPPARGAVEQARGINRSLRGPLPFVVASSAGGKFGPNGDANGSASQGFWHGYTIVRVDPSGDPARTIVEQRPIFDWITLTAQTHVLRPGQRMTLRGVGREPIATGGSPLVTRFNRIDSPAITHRYDLVEADPAQPWLPRKSADGDYVPLPADVATVDSQTGLVRTGRGNHPRAYAVAVLSVGDKAATWPLVFEPRRSFRPKPAASLPALPLPKVAASAAAAIQSPQSPPPVNPPTPQVNLPAPPTIPPLPTPSANPPAPPAPPVPPPPPVSPQATPLDLVTSPLGLNIAPQATVIPPPAPPIQPAPPGGARREARQRQAATQKSGADVGSEGVSEGVEGLGGDLADGPPVQEVPMTRRAQDRPQPSITVHHTPQPSAWPRNLAYGGGMTLAAAILALSYLTARPTPRRRRPERPAPARASARYARRNGR